MTIIWCIVPEIWNLTDRIFSHFGPFFALLPPKQPWKSKLWKNEQNTWRIHHFTNVYHKWQSYDVWSLRNGVQQKEFFLSFWKSKFWKTEKKLFGDFIFLNLSLCTINGNLMMNIWFLKYGERETEFSGYFFPFCPPNSPQNQYFLKMKKMLGVTTIFHTCAKNFDHMIHMITWYTCTLPEIWCTLQWINR